MKRGTNVFWVIILFAILIAIISSANRYIFRKDFTFFVSAVCDTEKENCFVSDCNPDEVECDTTPYKKVYIRKIAAPSCLENHTCEVFDCMENGGCQIEYCANELVEEGEICYEK